MKYRIVYQDGSRGVVRDWDDLLLYLKQTSHVEFYSPSFKVKYVEGVYEDGSIRQFIGPETGLVTLSESFYEEGFSEPSSGDLRTSDGQLDRFIWQLASGA